MQIILYGQVYILYTSVYFWYIKSLQRGILDIFLSPIVVLLESLYCAYGNIFAMTIRTLEEVFSHFLANLLWLKTDSLYWFSTVTTVKSNIASFWIEGIFTFFSK